MNKEPSERSSKTAIPCHVISGPLGVGKTTAILKFLELHAATENIAVIVNDFGKAGLDAEVLSASGANVEIRNIAGGCLCCSSTLDMREALEAVVQQDGLTRIVIEPSGLVVLPDFVRYLERLSEEFGLELRPIIALLNAKRTKESHYKALPYFSTLVDFADILVANRKDESTEAQLDHFRDWTSKLDPPKLKILETNYGELPAELFEMKRTKAGAPLKFYAPHTHDESSGGFAGELDTISGLRFEACIQEWIQNGLKGAEILRFKATIPTESGWRLFEIADQTCYVREMPESDEAKLDWISKGAISEETMRFELDSCRA